MNTKVYCTSTLRRYLPSTTTLLLLSTLGFSTLDRLQAQTFITRANNATLLNAGGAWGGTAPSTTTVAQFSTTLNAANAAVAIGGNVSWQGIRIDNPTQLINIGATGSSTLTLGSYGIVTTSSSTTGLTIGANVALAADQSWDMAANRPLTITGNIDNAGFNLTKLSGGNFTLSGVMSGTGGYTQRSGGTTVFSANNTYSGATTLQSINNTGHGITLNGANGAISGTSSVSLAPNSSLIVANTGAANNTNRVNDAAAISATGGVIQVTNDAAAGANFSESFSSFSATNGQTIINSGGQAATGQSNSVTFASYSRSGNASVVFQGASLGVDARNRILFTTAPTLTNGLIDHSTFYSNGSALNSPITGFASYDATNGIILAASTGINSSGATITNDPTSNLRINAGTAGNNSLQVPADTSVNTLIQSHTASSTITLASGSTFRANALMTTNTGALNIGGTAGQGTFTAATSGAPVTLITHAAANMTINANIADNGANPSSLIRLGNTVNNPAVLTSSNNSYTGSTIVRQGALRLNATNNDITSGGNSVLGNSTSPILIGDSGTPSGSNNNPNVSLEFQFTTDSGSATVSRSLDFSQANAAMLGRSRLRVATNSTGGVDTNTLTIAAPVTFGSRQVELFNDRGGQSMVFQGDITTSLGSGFTPGSIHLTGVVNTAPDAQGRHGGTFTFSNQNRSFSNQLQLTMGTVVIEGSVGATGTSGPIGTQPIALNDGNGGSYLNAGAADARRNVLLATAGTTYARDFSPGGGTGVSNASGNYVTNYGFTAGANGASAMLNSYNFGGTNTSGVTTFSGNILSASNINSVYRNGQGAISGTNYVTVQANYALTSATGGTTVFSGNINDTGDATTVTRITVNQVRNSPNLDFDVNGVPDTGRATGLNANEYVGTASQGTVVLSGTNTFAGSIDVRGGTLQIAKPSALYNGDISAWNPFVDTTVAANANVTPSGINVVSGATLAVNVGGPGEFTAANVDSILDNTNLGASAATGLQNGSNFGFDTTNAVGNNFAYGTVIANSNGGSNAIGLVKQGANTLTLTAANTYSGPTVVKAGNLQLNNTTGSGSGTGNLTVNVGATLSGNGTAGSNGTILVNGTLQVGAAGAAVGQDLQVGGSGSATTTLGSPSIVLLDLFSTTGTSNVANQAAADTAVFVGGVTIDSGASLIFGNPGNLTFALGDVFRVFDWSAVTGGAPTGTFTTVDTSALTLSGGTMWDTSSLYTAGTIAVVIPEPSRMILFGLGIAGMTFRRRRRE
jgi:autotransporter-associated beta strand protein